MAMASAVALGAAFVLSGCGSSDSTTTAAPDTPTPAEKTTAQKTALANRTAAAATASEAATADVLAFFDSSEFQAALQDCCPGAAQLSARELLEAFRAEAQVVELAHAFPSGDDVKSHFTDVTLDSIQSHDWFLNEWQVGFLSGSEDDKGSQNVASSEIFGLPRAPDTGYNWEEASDQMIYVAQNWFQQDTGSVPNFGDVTAVFDTEKVRDMLLIAPTDTGMWHMAGCDGDTKRPAENADGEGPLAGTTGPPGPPGPGPSPGPPGPGMQLNCSAWDRTVGTLDHLDHLLLPSFDVKADEKDSRVDKAKAFFERTAFGGRYEELPNISSNEYWESNIVGNPKLDAVKFLIGNFPVLFGTDAGLRLQQVASELDRPLAWALGTGGQSGRDVQLAGNQRFLDPTLALTNASLLANSSSNWQEVWQTATEARSAGDVAAVDVAQWWDALLGSQLRLAPLSRAACADASSCIGTAVATDDCICRSIASVLV